MGLAVFGMILCAICGIMMPRTRLQLLALTGLVGLLELLSLLYGIADYFTGEGITFAVLVHLDYGFADGELGVSRFPGLVAGVITAFMLFLAWSWVCWKCWRRRRISENQKISAWLVWTLIASGWILLPLHPAVFDLHSLYAESVAVDTSLTDDLVWSVESRSEEAHSFVYIYLESFEATFLDDEIFPGVAPRLKELESEGLTLKGIATSPLMNWTIGGMVASQCGMPMMTLQAASEDSIFQPGISCLGDFLASEGYYLSYVGGADLGFSGKGRFYRGHGFSTVLGRDELQAELGPDMPKSEWGAFDDTVFNRAQKEFEKLNQMEKPFGLFLLTTATHPHSGYPSPSCEDVELFDNPMLVAVHCSDGQVHDFVRWLKENGGDDLIIIVASDHLQVAGDASELLKRSEQRENLFMALGGGLKPRVIRRTSTMMDVAPTVAGLLGFDASGIGLGRNLLSAQPTLAEKYGLHRLNSMIPQWRLGLEKEEQNESGKSGVSE